MIFEYCSLKIEKNDLLLHNVMRNPAYVICEKQSHRSVSLKKKSIAELQNMGKSSYFEQCVNVNIL